MQEQRPLIQGLSTSEVEERRARGLGCVPPPATGRSYLRILRENVLNTVNIILFSIALALVLLRQYLDAIVSVGVVSFNMIISLVQEVRAKRTLDRIALLTRPNALVLRDGREQLIEPEELVVGDILVLGPGDQIVVDGPLVGDGCIEVDESLLTGESDLMTKREGDQLYAGTFCIAGRAYYRAEQVGVQSVAGRLTAGARAYRVVLTPLQREIVIIIRLLLCVAIFLEFLQVAAALISGMPMVEVVRMAMVIISIVPNGLFLSISVAYALGAVRMAGKGALIQRFNAMESLSHVDVLCTDKTGTLTTNMLELVALQPYGDMDEVKLRRLLGRYCRHLSNHNATSAAIEAACIEQGREGVEVRREIPFSARRRWGALVVEGSGMAGVYVLGAPDTLQPWLVPGADLGIFVEQETMQGRRVLLFAHADMVVGESVLTGVGECLPANLVPLGAISLGDHLRPEARETLERFARLGVQIKIISGDHPQTVARIVQQLGVDVTKPPLTGADIDMLNEEQLKRCVEEATIFGRIAPAQKERLVQALHSNTHYVAMIGDGVNDVLALKQADIGIAMQSGSQASRGVADVILLRDTFASLPYAVQEGQRIRNGMQDILKLFLTRVAAVTMLLISISYVGGIAFQPRQISILTFFTVGVPTLALAYWARAERVSQDERGRWSLLGFVVPASVTMGVVALCVYLGVFISALLRLPVPANPYREGPIPLAQTAMILFLVLCGLILVVVVEPPNRWGAGHARRKKNWGPVVLVLVLAISFMGVIAVPWLRTLFNLQMLSFVAYMGIGGACVCWGIWLWAIWHFHLFERLFQGGGRG
ncbi:HAD-IC family P-type ATPase [Dictyobacter aurantiacus]|nr:HAD-IC family P-type ATPase [Dictyobacter aurantiacus]